MAKIPPGILRVCLTERFTMTMTNARRATTSESIIINLAPVADHIASIAANWLRGVLKKQSSSMALSALHRPSAKVPSKKKLAGHAASLSTVPQNPLNYLRVIGQLV
jgi:hypothetical protein